MERPGHVEPAPPALEIRRLADEMFPGVIDALLEERGRIEARIAFVRSRAREVYEQVGGGA